MDRHDFEPVIHIMNLPEAQHPQVLSHEMGIEKSQHTKRTKFQKIVDLEVAFHQMN